MPFKHTIAERMIRKQRFPFHFHISHSIVLPILSFKSLCPPPKPLSSLLAALLTSFHLSTQI